MVIQKVRIPCRAVFPTGRTCNLAAALKDVADFKQYMADCEAKPTIEQVRCLRATAYLSMAKGETHLNYIRNGLRIQDASCIGTGSPDTSGFRFSRFRCTVVVQDNLAKGRLNVIVTGKTTLRWQII